MFPIQMTFSTEVPSRRTEDLCRRSLLGSNDNATRQALPGGAALAMILSTSTNGTSRGESVECREVTNAASQHLAADGARMQQPITKNALQK
jgi:hypothetical protein